MANDRIYIRHKKSGDKLMLATHGGGAAIKMWPSPAELNEWMSAQLAAFGPWGQNLGPESPFELIVEAQLR